MKRATASAGPSSANLGHGFDVLAVALDSPSILRDRVMVEHSHRWEVVVEGPAAGNIPANPGTNAAALAARAFTKSPLRITLWKGIRAGSGLGGSGASAAAAVRAVAALLGEDPPAARLVAAAAEGERASAGSPHADNVAASLLGGLVCVVPEAPLSWPLPKHVVFAIAVPEIEKTTRKMREVVPTSWPRALHTEEMSRAIAAALMLTHGQFDRLGDMIRNSVVERRRASLIPGHARVVAAAERAGAPAVTISGAGPTMIAIMDGRRTDPELVSAHMADAFQKEGISAFPAIATSGHGARVEEAR